MARRTVEVLECDRCGAANSTAYTMVFPEGTKEFVLCEKHDTPLRRLRDATYGEWKTKEGPKRRTFKKTSLEALTQ